MIQYANKILRDFRSHFIMLFIFFIIALLSFFLMRASIIANTQKLGNEVAHYYAMEEEKNFLSYKRFLIRIAAIINNLHEFTAYDKYEVIQELFTDLSATSLDDKNIMPYAVIDGITVAAKYMGTFDNELYKKMPWYNPALADGGKNILTNDLYKNSPWYDAALDADGKIILTDIYKDRITKEEIMTMALQINRSKKDVLAMDIFALNYKHPDRNSLLPAGSNYYLFDKKGNLFYYESSLGLSNEEIEKHAESIFENLHQSKYSDLKFIYDPHGKQKFIFHTHTADGLNILITIPYKFMVSQLYTLLYVTIGILLLLCGFIGINIFKTVKVNKHYEIISDTVNFLGNIYYAIFLIDIEKNSFTPIKMSDDIKQNLRHCKNYDDFLHVFQGIMENKVSDEFISAFSIQNLRRLSMQGIKEFGDDFKRIFAEGKEWVEVRIFLDYISTSDNAIICFKKVTEEKEAQMKQYDILVTAVENSKKSQQARNKFFASMSHDMRTPLNGILGFTELGLNHAKTLEETKEYLAKIKQTGDHLLELINHILELSREENKEVSKETEKVHLKNCIDRCLQPFFALSKTQHKEFSVKYSISDPYVYVPTFELTQVLNNIISNAFKYSRKYDKISLKVRQLDRSSKAKFQFVIEDTGIGMTKEFLKKIFIPYQREILFGAKEVLGTGLGMPIVKNIVTSLNGEINIESELNKGTKVTVILPFKAAEKDTVQEHGEEKEEVNLENVHVLLVEDNKINMEIAHKLLTSQDMLVNKAWNGKEAVDLFSGSAENFYDIILMDLQMPEMDGLEAAKQIRAMNRPDNTVPIIALSANAFSEDIALCLQAGMNDHIAKPFQPQKLFELIYQYTKGKQRLPAETEKTKPEPKEQKETAQQKNTDGISPNLT